MFWIINISLMGILITTVFYLIRLQFGSALKYFVGGIVTLILECTLISVFLFGGSPKKFACFYSQYVVYRCDRAINDVAVNETVKTSLRWVSKQGIKMSNSIIGCGSDNSSNNNNPYNEKDCSSEFKNIENQLDIELKKVQFLVGQPNNNNYSFRGIGVYSVNNIYTPRLFASNLNIENIINDILQKSGNTNYDEGYKEYIKKIWSMALFEIAENISNKMIFENNDEFESFIRDISTEGIVYIGKRPDLRPEIIEKISKIYRQKLIENKAWKNPLPGKQNTARLDLTIERMSGILTGLFTILDVWDINNNLNDIEKARIAAKALIEDAVILNILIPELQKSQLSNDNLLNSVIQDYKRITDTYFNENRLLQLKSLAGIGLNLLVFINSSTIIGSSAGPLGSIIGFAFGCISATALYVWNEGELYLLKYAISSFQYTIAIKLSGIESFKTLIKSSAVQAANSNMDKYIVGKLGKLAHISIITLPSIIEDISETNQWNEYLDYYFEKNKFWFITFSSDEGLLNNCIDNYLACINSN